MNLIISILALLISGNVFSQIDFRIIEFSQPKNLFPSNIITTTDKLVLIAEKNAGRLHLFKGDQYKHSYMMTSGLKKGLKKKEGDLKTPEGIYLIENHLTPDDLRKMYRREGRIFGSGALTLNYPNPVDKVEKKRGTNIWLHGTNEPERISEVQTSKGCIVVHNEVFLEILHKYKQEKMPLIIVSDLSWISKEARDKHLEEFEGLRTINQEYHFKDKTYKSVGR